MLHLGGSYFNAIYISRTIIHRRIGYEPLCEPIDQADDSLWSYFVLITFSASSLAFFSAAKRFFSSFSF